MEDLLNVAWALADVMDSHEKALGKNPAVSGNPKDAVAWAKVYSLFITIDQVMIDRGRWVRAFPLLRLPDPPVSAVRKPGKSLMPTPVSRLWDPRAAAILVYTSRRPAKVSSQLIVYSLSLSLYGAS